MNPSGHVFIFAILVACLAKRGAHRLYAAKCKNNSILKEKKINSQRFQCVECLHQTESVIDNIKFSKTLKIFYLDKRWNSGPELVIRTHLWQAFNSQLVLVN